MQTVIYRVTETGHGVARDTKTDMGKFMFAMHVIGEARYSKIVRVMEYIAEKNATMIPIYASLDKYLGDAIRAGFVATEQVSVKSRKWPDITNTSADLIPAQTSNAHDHLASL
jgi:hypothetical protein